MAAKRTIYQDPEYEAIPTEIQEKRIKLLEDNVRNQTKKKIESIIKSNFEQEFAKKDEEIDAFDELSCMLKQHLQSIDYPGDLPLILIQDKKKFTDTWVLHEGRCVLDRLRACIVTKYYATLGQEQIPNENSSSSIHPCVKKYIGKSPKYLSSNFTSNPESNGQTSTSSTQGSENDASTSNDSQFNIKTENDRISEKVWESNPSTVQNDEISTRAPRFKKRCKILVGNISKFIPVWQRDSSDQSTHKWMVYVRGDKHNPNIEGFVKKVRFLLHPSYRPSDIVEISDPPFHLVKRGWGEFPVRVQLHFHDPRNKPVDIIHNLKLDKTFTGLQTLGAETVVELQIFKPDTQFNTCNGLLTTASHTESYVASQKDNNVTLSYNGHIPGELNSLSKNSNVHTVVRKEPNSLVLNIKIPKNITNDSTSNQASIVNTHKIISPPCDSSSLANSAESNSQKKTVPKLVISRVTKPVSISNGINTTFVKCKDNSGRVLLVPQSSLTFKAPSNSAKQNNIPPPNSIVSNSNSTLENKNKTVPSYILKVVPNKDSGQKQIVVIPLADKKVNNTPVIPPVKIKTELEECETPNSVSDLETINKTEPQFEETVVTSPYLHYEQELEAVKLDYYKTFEELLKRVAKIFPLVKKGVDRTVFTFCANTLEEYRSWNTGKQRASEWRRAAMVRKSILNLLNKKSNPQICPESVWSQSAIMLWLRKNGFVPMATEKITLLPEPKWSGVELCSLSNADDLVFSLKEENSNLVNNSEEEEVEIIDICEDIKKPEMSTNQTQQGACYLPHSDLALFVKKTTSQLGIDIKPVELEPKLYVPAVEEMIVAACKELASDLIGAALNEGFNRLGGKVCPEEITVSDVYSVFKKIPHFDFLSNSCLGIPKEPSGST